MASQTPLDVMDEDTRRRLESVHRQTPRYLFRLWSDDDGGTDPSGGRTNLNTTTAITPPAFANGGGHASAYHMNKTQFMDMALEHLNTSHDIATEFSSCSASLCYVLKKCPGLGTGSTTYECAPDDHLFVSVVDVLCKANQAFYVPLLDFLTPGQPWLWDYSHETLVHGVVTGPYYKAIRYNSLQPGPRTLLCQRTLGYYDWYQRPDDISAEALTGQQLTVARKVGVMFGDHFAFEVTVALLCCRKRRSAGLQVETLNMIMTILKGMKLPPRCFQSDRFLNKPISTKHFSDTLQLQQLSAALRLRLKLEHEASKRRSENKSSRAVKQFAEQRAGQRRPDHTRPKYANVREAKSNNGTAMHNKGYLKRSERKHFAEPMVSKAEQILRSVDISEAGKSNNGEGHPRTSKAHRSDSQRNLKSYDFKYDRPSGLRFENKPASKGQSISPA